MIVIGAQADRLRACGLAGCGVVSGGMDLEIHWNLTRHDGNDDQPVTDVECVIEAEGIIRCDGEEAGEVGLTYVYAEDPESDGAFLRVWDLSAPACAIFEDIISPGEEVFREPVGMFLGGVAEAILCVHYIALKPAFRGRGVGRAVMCETVWQFADARCGAVLLDLTPIQHRECGYDDFFDEARGLPFNHPEVDTARLLRHFESWRMERIAGTRFMVAGPSRFCEGTNPAWYPALLDELRDDEEDDDDV